MKSISKIGAEKERTEDASMPKYVGKFDATKKTKDIKEITLEEITALKEQKNYGAVTGNIVEKLGEIIGKENEKLPTWKDKQFVTTSLLPVTGIVDGKDTKVAIVATVSAGKSTLLNVLCEYPILPAASGTTSCAPTYISRVASRSDEAIKIRPLKKVERDLNGVKDIEFVQDLENERLFKADTISETFYNDLLDYMVLVMCGNGEEYAQTLENIAYFMDSPENVDVEFWGSDQEKMSIKKENFALSYQNPRHRLMLLLILLCVYVKQNEKTSRLSPYYAEVNKTRAKIMTQYSIPAEGDYSVFLNWCSNSIPAGTTLVDLPGTGADTQDSDTQSSHTVIVKGILRDADALWILTSSNGVIEADLKDTLKDIVEIEKQAVSFSSTKNFVCIYNCKDGNSKDSKPIQGFIEKLPFLVGERCYAVDALAGEYNYLLNGISAENTKLASRYRTAFDDRTSEEIIKQLTGKFTKLKCPTYVVGNDVAGNIQVKQDASISFSLEGFFKTALTDYATRLKYEVAIKEALEQIDFYEYIQKELENYLGWLKSVDGKGPEITEAVNKALTEAQKTAMDNFIMVNTQHQAKVAAKLDGLGKTIGSQLKTAFEQDYSTLINRIHNEWKTLKQPGHNNGLETNWLGNYPLKGGHQNWTKFCRVRDQVSSYISVKAFRKATKAADDRMEDYNALLKDYVEALKKVIEDFRYDYMHAFSVEYERQKEQFCIHNGRVINDTLLYNFNSSKKKIQDSINDGLVTVCADLSKKYDTLIAADGIFAQLRAETNTEFTNRLSDNVLAKLRSDIRRKFTDTNHITKVFGISVSDTLSVSELDNLINNNFGENKKICKEELDKIVEAVYGGNLMQKTMVRNGDGKVNSVNFPEKLSFRLNLYNMSMTVNTSEKLNSHHVGQKKYISGHADSITNLGCIIKETETAIKDWHEIGNAYVEIGSYLITEGSPMVETLCSEYLAHVPQENK